VPSPAAKHNLFWLVVHGSFGPGGSDHGRLAELSGTWHPGSFAAIAHKHFSDLVVMRYHDEDVAGWALQIAVKPRKPGDANEADGNTPSQLFDTWARIDEIFGDDVVRMDTTFQFETSQPGEGDVCRANTYGSLAMVPEGRYDAPHPAAETVELWHHVVAAEKNYDPSIFRTLITDMAPTEYAAAFEPLPDHRGFLERLRRLDRDRTAAVPTSDVDDATLLDLARSAAQTKSQAVSEYVGTKWKKNEQLLSNLRFEIISGGEQPELGDLHYDLSEGFADATDSSTTEPWTRCLAEACYANAESYDLAYWLTKNWRRTSVDLEPLYELWKAGGSVGVDLAGVAHVSRAASR